MTCASTVESATTMRRDDRRRNVLALSARCSYCYSLAPLERVCVGDGLVYLFLEREEEAVLAHLLASLWTLDHSPAVIA